MAVLEEWTRVWTAWEKSSCRGGERSGKRRVGSERIRSNGQEGRGQVWTVTEGTG